MKKICVIGSINMDLIVMTDRFPKPGETLIGKAFHTFPGGKGANQAIALGRLQADVKMVGKVGNDIYGKQLLTNLQENSVNSDEVEVESGVSSGIAVIEVDETGENHIIIVAGANSAVGPEFIENHLHNLLESDIFLFQLEIPFDTVVFAMKKLKEHGKTIILDPAPARFLPDEIYKYIDYITPNETELTLINGEAIGSLTDMREAAVALVKKGVGAVIVKAGKNGAYLITENEFTHIPGFTVKAIDTTGAGDSFNAGMAVSLARGNPIKDSIRFANAVGALSTTANGAQNGMPTLDQVTLFMKDSDR